MKINVKDSREICQLSVLPYGECFEVDTPVEFYVEDLADRYFMKISGTVPAQSNNIWNMFVDIRTGTTHSLPRSTLVHPIQAKVEVERL